MEISIEALRSEQRDKGEMVFLADPRCGRCGKDRRDGLVAVMGIDAGCFDCDGISLCLPCLQEITRQFEEWFAAPVVAGQEGNGNA